MGYSRPQGIPAYAGPDGASNCGAPGAWAGSWECDRSVGIPPCLHQRAPEPLYSLCAKLRVRCSMHSRMHILQMMLTTCEACHAAMFFFYCATIAYSSCRWAVNLESKEPFRKEQRAAGGATKGSALRRPLPTDRYAKRNST